MQILAKTKGRKVANKKFEKALKGQAQSIPPIWMMRQAGRYHTHYQALRKQHGFMELCKDPKLASLVALGPVEEFDFDVAILFSDLLFPLEALGFGLSYDPGPRLDWYLSDLADFKKMNSLDEAAQSLGFQAEALKETRKQLPLDKSLIGFVGSPWTLFVYAVTGTHKGSLIEVKKRIHLFPSFLEIITPLMKRNIEIQLQGGAEVVMVFDTAAGELAAIDFRDLVQSNLLELSKTFQGRLVYYSKNTLMDHLRGFWQRSSFAGFGYDHRWNLMHCFSRHGGLVQGNFDQTLMFLREKEFETCLRRYLEPFQETNPIDRVGWVCGLGHGVLPETPEKNVKNFVRIVRESL